MKGLVGSNPPFSQLQCIAYKSPLFQQDTNGGKKACANILKGDRLICGLEGVG